MIVNPQHGQVIEIYFDEAAFSQNHPSKHSLFFLGPKGSKYIKRASGKGKRLMLEHCLVFVPACFSASGEDECFMLDGAELSLTSDGKVSEDFYKDVECTSGTFNAKAFETWAETVAKLLREKYPNAPIVAVYDNAGVHSVNCADCWPCDAGKKPPQARKGQMLGWLKTFFKVDEVYDTDAKKKKSLETEADREVWGTWHWCEKALATEVKACAMMLRGTEYKIDKVFLTYNIRACRTPPYYPEFQPMEYIWSYMKWYVYVESDYDGNFAQLPKYVAEAWKRIAEAGHLMSYRNKCMKNIAEACVADAALTAARAQTLAEAAELTHDPTVDEVEDDGSDAESPSPSDDEA